MKWSVDRLMIGVKGTYVGFYVFGVPSDAKQKFTRITTECSVLHQSTFLNVRDGNSFSFHSSFHWYSYQFELLIFHWIFIHFFCIHQFICYLLTFLEFHSTCISFVIRISTFQRIFIQILCLTHNFICSLSKPELLKFHWSFI